jgi:hypothetical protein
MHCSIDPALDLTFIVLCHKSMHCSIDPALDLTFIVLCQIICSNFILKHAVVLSSILKLIIIALL